MQTVKHIRRFVTTLNPTKLVHSRGSGMSTVMLQIVREHGALWIHADMEL